MASPGARSGASTTASASSAARAAAARAASKAWPVFVDTMHIVGIAEKKPWEAYAVFKFGGMELHRSEVAPAAAQPSWAIHMQLQVDPSLAREIIVEIWRTRKGFGGGAAASFRLPLREVPRDRHNLRLPVVGRASSPREHLVICAHSPVANERFACPSVLEKYPLLRSYPLLSLSLPEPPTAPAEPGTAASDLGDDRAAAAMTPSLAVREVVIDTVDCVVLQVGTGVGSMVGGGGGGGGDADGGGPASGSSAGHLVLTDLRLLFFPFAASDRARRSASAARQRGAAAPSGGAGVGAPVLSSAGDTHGGGRFTDGMLQVPTGCVASIAVGSETALFSHRHGTVPSIDITTRDCMTLRFVLAPMAASAAMFGPAASPTAALGAASTSHAAASGEGGAAAAAVGVDGRATTRARRTLAERVVAEVCWQSAERKFAFSIGAAAGPAGAEAAHTSAGAGTRADGYGAAVGAGLGPASDVGAAGRDGGRRSVVAELAHGWDVYSEAREFARIGATDNPAWRVSTANANFEVCPTYPRTLVVPSLVDDVTVGRAARHRTKRRVPALSWLHPEHGTPLCRSSQPRAGLTGSSDANDVTLLAGVLDAGPIALAAGYYGDGDAGESMEAAPAAGHGPSAAAGDAAGTRAGGGKVLHILDCRPMINAQGNRFKGGGLESVGAYRGRRLGSTAARAERRASARGSGRTTTTSVESRATEGAAPDHEESKANGHVRAVSGADTDGAVTDGDGAEGDDEGEEPGVSEAVGAGGGASVAAAEAAAAAVAGAVGSDKGGKQLPWARLEFLNIANIHAMRGSVMLLLAAAAGPNDRWQQARFGSQWESHVAAVLAGGVRAATLLQAGQPVLVHCSDGWDRTAQVSALAQFLLDPYYRTMEGFEVLMEKEWAAFGHKLGQRCASNHAAHKAVVSLLATKPGARAVSPGFNEFESHEFSPVLLQWLDCVWQVCQQFPWAVEFTEAFLLQIATHVHSSWFGTFMYNSERERELAGVRRFTVSMWSFLNANRASFLNPLYVRADAARGGAAAADGTGRLAVTGGAGWSQVHRRSRIDLGRLMLEVTALAEAAGVDPRVLMPSGAARGDASARERTASSTGIIGRAYHAIKSASTRGGHAAAASAEPGIEMSARPPPPPTAGASATGRGEAKAAEADGTGAPHVGIGTSTDKVGGGSAVVGLGGAGKADKAGTAGKAVGLALDGGTILKSGALGAGRSVGDVVADMLIVMGPQVAPLAPLELKMVRPWPLLFLCAAPAPVTAPASGGSPTSARVGAAATSGEPGAQSATEEELARAYRLNVRLLAERQALQGQVLRLQRSVASLEVARRTGSAPDGTRCCALM